MKIERSWSGTWKCLGVSVAFGVGTYFAYGWASGANGLAWLFAWVVTIGAALLCLGFFIAAFLEWKTTCARCRREISWQRSPDSKFAQRCPECREWLASDAGVVIPLPEDFIADEPVFSLALPNAFRWPPGCCVCGAPATRGLKSEYKQSQTGRNAALAAAGLAVGFLIVRTGGGKVSSVEVPHCAEHEGGAKLDEDDKSPTKLQVRFRSYRYFRTFEAMNTPEAAGAGEHSADVDAA